MIDPTLASFLVLAVVLAVTPGADTMIVLKNAAAGGTKRGILTMVGVKLGTTVHALLAGVGIAAILLQFSAAYSAMKLIGAAYLVWLGAQSLLKAARGTRTENSHTPVAQEAGTGRTICEGFLSNILNPKVVLFYVAVLPQFVDPDNPLVTSVLLGGAHILISAVWLTVVSLFIGVAQRWIEHPPTRRWIDGLSGLAIAGFGIKLALSKG